MGAAIVVGTDGSTGSQAAVIQAGRLAAAYGGRVVVVAAYANPQMGLAPEAMVATPDGEQRAKSALEAAAAQLERAGVPHDERAVCGVPAEALCDVARLESAEAIVVGSRGMRGARRLLGSVPNAVSHRAPCTVMIVRTD